MLFKKNKGAHLNYSISISFRLFLTEEQVSLFIVHLGGLIIDLSIGFFLLFDKTRPLAFVFGASFHLMNSQLFSIGE